LSVAAAIGRYRLIVCVGTGGVGKTTIAAAIAIAAARRGLRAMVLTIDPARALARAMGLAGLAGSGQRVADLDVPGVLSAAMLDPKQSWDAFIARHAPSASVADALLANPFYQRVSTTFAGSTEYMAVEELCRLAESGEHDLIVLDTPPAAHALDFVRAPERIDRLLDPEVAAWFARPYGVWRSAGAGARFVLRRLEHVAGKSTLRDISAFFVALDALVGGVIARTRQVRALLARDAGFALVAAPRQLVLAETEVLRSNLAGHAAPLVAAIVNRVHAPPRVSPEVARAALAALGDGASPAWLRAAWDDAVGRADEERADVARFAAALPDGIPIARVDELDRDVHSLADLVAIAGALES
jgi:anion-transporting  ArsA/GET3 family ATPase